MDESGRLVPDDADDYHAAVTGALGVEPVWEDGPAWTGLDRALAELVDGLRR